MQVNDRYALVLAAGFGSRMGALGKELPKPLWPVFSTNVLGHLINQLREVGFQKIYVNAHHQAQKIIKFIRDSYPEVEVLVENPILDSAGCIVNCAKTIGNASGVLYTFNADNLIDLSSVDFGAARKELTLFSEIVQSADGYNKLRLENGCLREIMKPGHARYEESNITYAGISCIALSSAKLQTEVRPLGLFKDFLDLSRDEIRVTAFEGKQIDLGTYDLYRENLFKLIRELASNKCEWNRIMEKYCGYDASKLNHQTNSYNSPMGYDCLNFSGKPYQGEESKVVLFSVPHKTSPESNTIFYDEKSY